MLVEVVLNAFDDEAALLMGEVAPVEANIAVGEDECERPRSGRGLAFPREVALRERELGERVSLSIKPTWTRFSTSAAMYPTDALPNQKSLGKFSPISSGSTCLCSHFL